ncbi:MAG: methyltransferase domain-containing protein [Gemmatimonadetes bacterium]|nr:methyltransferase domain-containing protein [Gemmatimonadota bacterium]
MTSPTPTAYDVAHHYDDAYFGDLAERYARRSRFARWRIRNVLSMLPDPAGLTVVDIGCGMGTFTIESARRGARAFGIDPAPAAVAAARRVALAEGVASTGFVRADAAMLPVRDAASDAVIAADLIEHLDDDTLDRVLREARRILRPGGRLVLYTPNRGHLFECLRDAGLLRDADPSHIGLRSAAQLRNAVARAGFVRLAVRFLPSHLPGWNVVERLLARWVPPLRRRIGLTASVEAS